MISTSPLYDPANNRYKGVYAGPGYNQWDAIVQTPKGKLERKGRFETPEAAAQAVAEYYHSVYGPDWPKALKDRLRRTWRVRQIKRYPYRADLHRGPSVVVWIADVRLSISDDVWYRITLRDILSITDNNVPDNIIDMWDDASDGWKTNTVAVIAIRIYKAHKALEQVGSARLTPHPSGGCPAPSPTRSG